MIAKVSVLVRCFQGFLGFLGLNTGILGSEKKSTLSDHAAQVNSQRHIMS